TEDDLMQAKKVPHAQVETGKQIYYANAQKNEVAQIFSYSDRAKQNKLKVVEGHLPEKQGEIVLDEKAKNSGYKIGDSYTIDSKDLVQKEYKVVGFVRSPLFINNLERGYANLGN